MRKRLALAVCTALAFSTLLSACGVVELDNGCALIKKISREKIDIGRTMLEMIDEGKLGEGLTIEEGQSQWYEYIIEGTQIAIDNPQCFSSNDVQTAKNLLSQ